MNAAEKLRALEPLVASGSPGVAKLVDALPELIAAVDAAEHLRFGYWPPHDALRDALEALTAKLDAG